MDFRYVIILISGIFFYTLINQLTEPLTEWFIVSVIICYGIAIFFISPLILDDSYR
jgi:hypothetical protein